ncbi:Rpn family recombination-promoting nuclease/putative transposase [Thiocystis violascens]|uniref:Putative transposase, YhgA n=1 Tax=Thiocystis violascens (strain ATCC 17096 / DSM 198 / 6111) TaxID=765911 RepID=I3YGN9_THIV6|nr:Rpn family recombination-promoting nuclease/putative transposase [Thiocystis violascens]AFL76157.1 Putative transposase, YhgA [Thiocystis violascens DSM 198]
MAEHDSSYKLLFSHRELVADLIRGFVNEDWTQSLDFDTLERVREIGVSHDLREREDDILWRLRLIKDGREHWLYVYLLLEFQSSVDPYMAVRLLTYVGLLYEDLRKADAIRAGEPLPAVLPIVLYNGRDSWTAKTSLSDLIDPDLPPQLRAWQPQIRYLLLEERRYAEADLAGLQNVAAALFRLENSRAPADIQRVVASLLDWLAAPEQTELRRAFVVWLKRVLLPSRVPGVVIPNVIELEELHSMLAETVKTWVEEWKELGWKQGIEQGIERGIEQGIERGIERGIEQGIEQGIHRGETKILRRLLMRRFGTLPAWVGERLEQAEESEIECWTDRVLDCDSLERIFGESH